MIKFVVAGLSQGLHALTIVYEVLFLETKQRLGKLLRVEGL